MAIIPKITVTQVDNVPKGETEKLLKKYLGE